MSADFGWDLTEEERLLQSTAREFATREVAPGAIERDARERYGRTLFRRMGELGLTAAPLPEADGDAGFSHLGWSLVMEELGRADMAMAVSLSVHLLSQLPVVAWGTEEQKARWLPEMVSGEALGAFPLTEPHAGSDAAALRLRAELDGDVYRLTGTKIWVTNAPEAERYLVFATVDSSLGSKGITAFLVASDTPGFRFGRLEHKMGIRSCPASGAGLRRRAGAGVQPAGRGRGGLPDRLVFARRGADLDRLGLRGPRPVGARPGCRVPAAAARVRRAARRPAGPPVHAGGDGRGRGWRTRRDPGGSAGARSRGATGRGLVHCQVDCLRRCDARLDRRGAALRWQRLLARNRRGATHEGRQRAPRSTRARTRSTA